MEWSFELVAGPFEAAVEGLAWDGEGLLFSIPESGLILRFDPAGRKTVQFRNYTNQTCGLAFSPAGELHGCQQLSRRVVRFNREGSTSPLAYRFEGLPYQESFHNMPRRLTFDAQGRIWFSDPRHRLPATGPALPFPDHQSVLRLQMRPDRSWTLHRATFDTSSPSGVAVAPDGGTLYVADAGSETSELRAYPIGPDGRLGRYRLLHSFGADDAGRHRGIEGMRVDAEGNVIACAGSPDAGPGPIVYVFAPTGRVLETHPIPGDDPPMDCCFGGAGLTDLYVSTASGRVYCVRNPGIRGQLPGV